MQISGKKIYIAFGLMILFFSFFYVLTIKEQQRHWRMQENYYLDSLHHLHSMLEINKHKNLGELMSVVLLEMDAAVKDKNTDTLSDQIILRVAALSYSLLPEELLNKEILQAHELSPERGQLLLSLANMDLDSGSFEKIKSKTLFSGADLRSAPIEELNLCGVNLKKANLSDATLFQTNLASSNLEKAILVRAKLSGANLSSVDAVRSNFSWAELNDANLSLARLSGADFTAASIRGSNLNGAIMDFGKLNGAFLNASDLSDMELTGTDLRGANLTDVNLSRAVLKLADFEGANMSNTILEGAIIDRSDWLEKLIEWNVIGANEIHEKYTIKPDTLSTSGFVLVSNQ